MRTRFRSCAKIRQDSKNPTWHHIKSYKNHKKIETPYLVPDMVFFVCRNKMWWFANSRMPEIRDFRAKLCQKKLAFIPKVG